ncbi:NmrA family NAD(P)-binding protein [Microbacterium sp. MPKO10]|uniref:NmrA family NAD(P)-binding protein n=1 Tax=Microbacterium sp. MPKO10 TaxID=2989818 RepID=UPI002235D1F5|nr:NmrA family NAD(P)-binding protein [Microbacterium sp. MPKO10]MCW4457375.1 NAD(P)H-binding protein [Microbacterium sp. MPKO10]
MIVITAPTGRIGSKLLTTLLAHDEPVRVIARDPEKLPAAARERFEVIVGSHRDPHVLDAALPGANVLFWLMPAEKAAHSIYDAYVSASIPGAEAVHRHGVERVVMISALGRESGIYGGHVSASLAMEDLFRSTGIHVRALANPTFMDNFLLQIPAIKNGVITGTLPADLRLPMVATKDIAAVASRLLLDRAWTGQDTVEAMGPDDLSLNDIAETLSAVLGRPIRFQPGDRGADKQALIGYGFSDAVAQAMIDMDIAKERGIDLVASRTAENATPTTFREFAEDVITPALSA